MKIRGSLLISLCVLALALTAKLVEIPLLAQLQLATFDSFQRLHPRVYTPLPVKIIDIDDESLAKLGQWPWSRNVLAQLTTRLSDLGAAAIGLDVVFAEPDRTSPPQLAKLWQTQHPEIVESLRHLPDHDAAFALALSQFNAVTGFVLTH